MVKQGRNRPLPSACEVARFPQFPLIVGGAEKRATEGHGKIWEYNDYMVMQKYSSFLDSILGHSMHLLNLYLSFGAIYHTYLLHTLVKHSEFFIEGCRAHMDMREKNSNYLDTV